MKKALIWYFAISIVIGVLPILMVYVSYGVASLFGCAMPSGSIDSGYYDITCTVTSAPKDFIGLMYRSHVFLLFSIPVSVVMIVVGTLFALIRAIVIRLKS